MCVGVGDRALHRAAVLCLKACPHKLYRVLNRRWHSARAFRQVGKYEGVEGQTSEGYAVGVLAQTASLPRSQQLRSRVCTKNNVSLLLSGVLGPLQLCLTAGRLSQLRSLRCAAGHLRLLLQNPEPEAEVQCAVGSGHGR